MPSLKFFGLSDKSIVDFVIASGVWFLPRDKHNLITPFQLLLRKRQMLSSHRFMLPVFQIPPLPMRL
jgi:hypothetical protein